MRKHGRSRSQVSAGRGGNSIKEATLLNKILSKIPDDIEGVVLDIPCKNQFEFAKVHGKDVSYTEGDRYIEAYKYRGKLYVKAHPMPATEEG